MKSYADDLPNADTVIKALQDENAKITEEVARRTDDVHAHLDEQITALKEELAEKYEQERALRIEDSARGDDTIRQIKNLTEEYQQWRKSSGWFHTIILIAELSILALIIYHTFGENLPL